MPISFTITVITALSMAGVPPFNGFLSKESFLEQHLQQAKQIYSVLIH